MKVIVTGATGFVGKNLCTFLEQEGVEVEELSLRKKNWDFDTNADVFIHLAGRAHNDKENNKENIFSINTELTKKIFDDFKKSNIKDFFYFSSVKAVTENPDGVLHEDCYSEPTTDYGRSKLLAEKYILSQMSQGVKGKRFFIIRPVMIYGPNNKGNLNFLFRLVNRRVPWPLASFQNKRSFLFIENLNFLILSMIKNDNIKSGIFNFCDDNPISINNLIKTISKIQGKKIYLWKVPKKIIIIMANIGDMLKLPVNSNRIFKLTNSYVVSNKKIKNALGIEELPYSIEEGLEKTIKSFNVN